MRWSRLIWITVSNPTSIFQLTRCHLQVVITLPGYLIFDTSCMRRCWFSPHRWNEQPSSDDGSFMDRSVKNSQSIRNSTCLMRIVHSGCANAWNASASNHIICPSRNMMCRLCNVRCMNAMSFKWSVKQHWSVNCEEPYICHRDHYNCVLFMNHQLFHLSRFLSCATISWCVVQPWKVPNFQPLTQDLSNQRCCNVIRYGVFIK